MKLGTKVLAVAATVAMAVTGAMVVASSANAVATPGSRSGLPWVSGAYLDNSPTNITAYETGRGRKLDAIEVFTDRTNATTMVDPWWVSAVTPVTSTGGQAIVTVPLWAQNQNVNTDTTALFTNLGKMLNAQGLASKTTVRLGWEMNLTEMYWNVTTSNRTAWVADFKRAANLLRQYAPGVKIAFNPNEGTSATTLKAIDVLANDLSAYYDYVGIDFYNWYDQMDTQAQWDARYKRAFGMQVWENKAIALGKGFGVFEWGGSPEYNNSTGVFYAQQMIKRFAALSAAGVPVIESHFNEPADYSQNSLWAPTQMPAMAAAVKAALASQPSSGVSSSPTASATVTPTPTVTTSVPSCN